MMSYVSNDGASLQPHALYITIDQVYSLDLILKLYVLLWIIFSINFYMCGELYVNFIELCMKGDYFARLKWKKIIENV
jgi:hypothetical protein